MTPPATSAPGAISHHRLSHITRPRAIKNAPIEVIDGPLSGLPLPAQAEIILEGELLVSKEAPVGAH